MQATAHLASAAEVIVIIIITLIYTAPFLYPRSLTKVPTKITKKPSSMGFETQSFCLGGICSTTSVLIIPLETLIHLWERFCGRGGMKCMLLLFF